MNPAVATSYFRMAAEKSFPLSLYHQAIAETESDSLHYAYASWDSLRKSADKRIISVAEKMIKVLSARSEQLGNLSDEEKYFFCRYRIQSNDKKLFDRTVQMITDGSLRAQAIIDRSKKLFSMDELAEASLLLDQLQTSYTRNINQQVANLRLMLAASKGDLQFVKDNLAGTEVSLIQKVYFDALLAAQAGNQNTAEQKFKYLSKTNYYFDEGVVASVRFFSGDTALQMKNFSLLVDGLLAKPFSVKILKEHAVMAAALGYPDAAQDSLNKLQAILPKESFKRFADSHRDYFGTN
jgi:hypothetical protein